MMNRLKMVLGLLLGAVLISSCAKDDVATNNAEPPPATTGNTQTKAHAKFAWVESYDKGMEMAAAENKLVMLKFTAPW